MKILLWIGNESNQIALASKIEKEFGLAGVVLETRISKRKTSLKKLIEKVIESVFLRKIGTAWISMKNYYSEKFSLPSKVRTLNVENINSEEAYNFSSEIEPDLIIVSGTRLVKEQMLSINPKIGILNLHTGLSPYIKGGPNCTNWCIATKQFNLIGNTIMWIDLGIDTGNILTTETTEFTGKENLNEVHLKVMEHAHALYLKSIKHLAEGKTSNVKQEDIAEGKTYYTKQWGISQKIQLVRNFSKFRNGINKGRDSSKIKTISIKN